MRRHDVTTLRAITRLKEGNSARPTCTCKQEVVSAPERDKRWDKLTIQCHSQKHITYLDIHCNACLKHFNSPLDQYQDERDEDSLFVCLPPLLCPAHRHLPHTITAMVIWASPSRLTYAAANSHKQHQTLDMHALSLAEQSLGESVMAISHSTPQRLKFSEHLEALLPMECVPEISLSRARSESRISPR